MLLKICYIMNRVIKILEILEGFFQRGPQSLSIYRDDSVNPSRDRN